MNDDLFTPPLELGDSHAGTPVFMSEDQRRRHMHVIGATGSGKTYFLERLIRQDIDNGQGVCVLDPTGNLYDALVRWCETHYIDEERKIILIDPSEPRWVVGFNPFDYKQSPSDTKLSIGRIATETDNTLSAILRSFGDATNAPLPQIRFILRVLIYTLAEHGLTLNEARLASHPDPASPVRSFLSSTLRNDEIRSNWETLSAYRPFEYEGMFAPIRSRLQAFLMKPCLSNMLSVTQGINFLKAMDEQQVILVNLAPRGKEFDESAAQLLGSLIVNGFASAAQDRPPDSDPFYFYIDECYSYLNDDIAKILDKLRQFGLHLILSHQFLTQLTEDGSQRIHDSIMSNARTKVVFQLEDPKDAEVMARRIYKGEIDREEPKHALDRALPTGTFRREYLESEGESEQTGNPSTNWSDTEDDEGKLLTKTTGESDAAGGYSRNRNIHETLVPEYETSTTAPYSEEEQYSRKEEHLGSLPLGCAVVKIYNRPTVDIGVPILPDSYAEDERVEEFKNRIYSELESEGVAHRTAKINQERKLRLEQIQKRALTYDPELHRVVEGELVPAEEPDWFDNE